MTGYAEIVEVPPLGTGNGFILCLLDLESTVTTTWRFVGENIDHPMNEQTEVAPGTYAISFKTVTPDHQDPPTLSEVKVKPGQVTTVSVGYLDANTPVASP